MINRKFFFDAIRQNPFNGSLDQAQADGLTFLLDRWEQESTSRDERHLAYILATVFHETAATMQPIRERGGQEYFRRNYDVTGRDPVRARANGNTTAGDGARYFGRGFVQLTWKNNYRRVGGLISVDLVSQPERALEPTIAAEILFRGMAEGWFTGRSLAEFLAKGKSDWINARRIINGIDRATLIATYGKEFLFAIHPMRMDIAAAATPLPPSSRRVSKPSGSKSPKPPQRPAPKPSPRTASR